MTTPREVVDTMESRYCGLIKTASEEVTRRRGTVEEKERDRDQLIAESAPVVCRERAAECAGLSVSRIDQIRGGAA